MCVCAFFKLTDAELKQGELIIEQLQRVGEEPFSWNDIKPSLKLAVELIKEDWMNCSLAVKLWTVQLLLPLIYTLWGILHIIIC